MASVEAILYLHSQAYPIFALHFALTVIHEVGRAVKTKGEIIMSMMSSGHQVDIEGLWLIAGLAGPGSVHCLVG